MQADEPEGTVIIADEQTAGRGRLNRSWLSEPKKNLIFSVIIRPVISPEKIGVLSLYAGVAVVEGVKEILNLQPACKWPNDVQLSGKKFCGILSETLFSNGRLSGVVIGIGLNVNQSIFPDEIKNTATSLNLETGKEQNRFEVLGSVFGRMEYYYGKIQDGNLKDILDRWLHYSAMMGREITINRDGNITKGIASRINDDGGLIINTNGGELKALAGDVTVCL